MLAVLNAAPASTPTIAAPGLSALELPEKTAQFWTDHLAEQLTQRGLKVVTASGVAAVLGIERKKQLLGCSSESSSCLAELTDALGAAGLLTGSVARFGKKYQLNVEIVASGDARVLASFSEKAPSEGAMLDVLDRAAASLAEQALAQLRPSTQTRKGFSKAWGFVPAGVGVGLGVASGVLLVLSRGHYDALVARDGSAVGIDPVAFANAGASQQVSGVILGATAVAAFAAAGVVFAMGEAPKPIAWVTPQGGGFGVAGSFP
jgi:hypothetical protein